MTTSDAVRLERRAHVLVIEIHRPDAMNAITREVSDAIADALIEVETDMDVRAIVLTGSGDKVFSAGADLKALARGERVVSTEGERAAYGLGGCTGRTSRVPLIVAANGSAFGGGFEILLAADITVVERGRVFGLPEVERGIFAAAGGAYRLPRAIPPAVALDLLCTGEPITAERGAALGLFSRLVDPGEAIPEALEIAERIAANAPLAVTATKQIARHLMEAGDTAQTRLQQVSDEMFAEIAASADAVEGARAFVEKRRPVWSGS
ncbi:enoyl-CoA hydratase-related protein [Microbacterium sp. GXF7504]